MTNLCERQHSASTIPSALEPPEESLTEPGSPYQSEVMTLRQELATLRAEFAAFRAAMASAASPESTALPAVSDTVATGESEHEPSGGMTTRRTLLKWGGLGAAAALAAAGGATLTGQTAHAADGANLVVGTSNTAESATILTYDGTSSAATGFAVDTGTSQNSTALSVTAGNTSDNNSYSYGIYAASGSGLNSYGVFGEAGSEGVGVEGTSSGDSAYGVWGFVPSGFGIVGQSNTGIDIAAGGTGRIFQLNSGFRGAPTGGSYLAGEQIRDDNGDLYICIVGGSPGTWRKVAAGVPGASGAINFLTAPIRLLDTRTSSAWTAGSNHRLQVADGINVPGGAVGVVGNVTVVSPTGGGDLRLYPAGASLPSTSSINFAAGQIIANGVIVGLNGSGQLAIQVDMPGGTHTHVLFDASGYIV